MYADHHLVAALTEQRHADAARRATARRPSPGRARLALGHALVRLGTRLSGVSPGPRHA